MHTQLNLTPSKKTIKFLKFCKTTNYSVFKVKEVFKKYIKNFCTLFMHKYIFRYQYKVISFIYMYKYIFQIYVFEIKLITLDKLPTKCNEILR